MIKIPSTAPCRVPLFIQTLTARGFDVEQYLLSPVQMGIPNTRLRYYCLASRRHADGEGKIAPIKKSLPRNSLIQPDEQTVPLRPLSEFLVSTAVLIGLGKVASAWGIRCKPSLHFNIKVEACCFCSVPSRYILSTMFIWEKYRDWPL